ncbi:hypothetical protein [Actinoplanes sp. NPDC026670]|uniref:hypothetical protein n=1 Tax=Actinoplanes sp. NPDC026670 TaxID=3154700 RepID=UPI003408B6ED
MRTRRWVIIGTGAVAVAALITAAVLFGLRGVEAVSWIAGVASLVVAVAVMIVTWPSAGAGPAAVQGGAAPERPAPEGGAAPQPPAPEGHGPAARSVTVDGGVDGIVSTGDGTTNIQHR